MSPRLARVADGEQDLEETPAAASSALAGLRARRDKARAAKHLDLVVPDLEPPLYVRFRATSSTRIDAINVRHEKAKPKEKIRRTSTELLAECCMGIFELGDDGEPAGQAKDWPRFEDLAEQFELPPDAPGLAERCVGELYVDEGDLVAVSDRLIKWSLRLDEDLERVSQGE